MSTRLRTLGGTDALAADTDRRAYRTGALVCLAVLTGTYLAVLYHVVDVVGGVSVFLPLVAAAVLLAMVLATALSHRGALAVTVVLLLLGLAAYVGTAPASYVSRLSLGVIFSDVLALLTGFSVLRMTNAGVWALSVTPGPVFLTWYFAVRSEYVRAAAVGSAVLGFFVLTGDSGTVATLLGVLGAAGALAFTTLSTRGGRRDHLEVLAVTAALMILASATVAAVPGGGSSPLGPGGHTPVDAGLIAADDRASILGSIRLSPEVRFVVESTSPALWRVNAYDRFTGRGWIATGGETKVEGSLDFPPGPRQRVFQTVTPYTTLDVLPSASEPYQLQDVSAAVTEQGVVEPTSPIGENASFSVVSLAPNPTQQQLRTAGTDYPAEIESMYLGLPESTPSRVSDLAANVTSDADTPLAKARAIEGWLERNKQYSLDVPAPSGQVVDSFLFEMEQGYCVYYATAMTVMLRSQGVPARYVVGYQTGQRVAEDEWVVRGTDAHAWVEVYFPDVGWVPFDPTPSAPRERAENSLLEDARQEGVSGVDARDSEEGTWTPTTSTPDPNDPTNPGGDTVDRNRTTTRPPWIDTNPVNSSNFTFNFTTTPNGSAAGGAGGPSLPRLPPPETLAVWSLLAVGLAAGARRSGLAERAYREVWLRWQPERGPLADVEGAYDRVEYALGRRTRPRRPGETVREYLAAIDADRRAREVARLREQARYAGRVDEDTASTARSLAAEYVTDGGG